MNFQFWKMQSCGNDFVVIDTRKTPFELSGAFIKQLANRHFGIGFDSLLLLEPAKNPAATALYRVFNADGTEAGQCGNGARCIAQLLFQQSNEKQLHFTLETIDQSISLDIIRNGLIKANLAIPEFAADKLPIKLPAKLTNELATYEIDVNNHTMTFYGVSLGNPHVITFVDDLEEVAVTPIGIALNKNPAFPQGVNVSFVELDNEHSLKVRVYERGVGETLACGSAACASSLVAIKLQKAANPIQVFLPGGTVQVDWLDHTKPVSLTGSAEFVFKGIWDDALNAN